MAASVVTTIADFRARPTAFRCLEISKTLRALGFDVREGAGPGHRVVSHAALDGFHGAKFNCGHGKNGLVKPFYVRDLANMLDRWKAELEAIS